MDIPEGKYLGTLCKRGHEWEDSGKSLRVTSGSCVSCSVIGRDKYKKKMGRREYLRKSKVYYYANKEKCLAANKKRYELNKDKILRQSREYRIANQESAMKRRIGNNSKYKTSIPKGKFVGNLCAKNHKWKGIRKSLRYVGNSGCVECSIISSAIKRKSLDKKVINTYVSEWKKTTNGILSMQKKSQWSKVYMRKPETKERVRINRLSQPSYRIKLDKCMEESKVFADEYIRKTLASGCKIPGNKMPQQLVDAKRIQMKIFRLLKEV